MSKPKHTSGPWATEEHDGQIQITSGEDVVSQCSLYGAPHHAEQRANAARIVACVNAMEGIDDPAAARALLDDPRMTMAADLLEALINALPYVEDMLDDPAFKPGVVKKDADKIRALLARAEERK